MKAIELNSDLTCPFCGFIKSELMPSDSCMYFYECTACHSLIRPRPGDCCVFCSYGSAACPPKQNEAICCDQSNDNNAAQKNNEVLPD